MTDDAKDFAARLARAEALPRYSAPILDIVAEPPFLHRDTVLHCLILKSDIGVLQAAVDDMFAPLGLSYQVASSAVLLTALYVGRASASGGQYGRYGWSSEIDVAFWALARGSDGKLVWIPFYMFVDSGIALVAGREIFGFPKQIAQFDRDMSTLGSDAAVSVRTDFFLPSLAPAVAVRDTLVRIRAADGVEMKSMEGIEKIDESAFEHMFADAMGLGESIVNEVTPPYGTPNGIAVPMLFLKQLRDAAAPDRACYRAAILADTKSVGMVSLSVIGKKLAVDLTPSVSHPIARDLGLVSGMIAETGFVIRQDFDVNIGRVLT
ncbi:acetoacetate decarboxylase family protein [Sphingomonas sp. ERG5]|uniref:acetoacetate decarboxylase family protein n=1 Tax=Sphingomonas sp. ERG5 TaxID=1381597 RepID=UPI000AEDA6CB|nr:acetoacetate decarboxylase family protein [Sphingomonas sp. ERG5]